MPNHVTSVITLSGDESRIKAMLEQIKNDEVGIGSVDFNKVLPMPESLHMTSGSIEDSAIAVCISAINPVNEEYEGIQKMDVAEFREMLKKLPVLSQKIDILMPENEAINLAENKYRESVRYLVDEGAKYISNLVKYGASTWYDWAVGNWGTKWNAYGYDNGVEMEDGKMKFLTAWAAPHPIMQKLSEMYPDIKFEHEWADEDIGNNCGRYVYYDGKRIEEYFPESQKDCLEFAANVMDASLEEDYSLYLNATETEYINIEYDDEYELIEVAGHTALFTNDRITDANIPKGMYCYHLRHNDDGEFFAIEKNVSVNHAVSIVTKEPIDLKSKGYIVLDEDSSPNFLGENMSLYMFREYDPGQTEELSIPNKRNRTAYRNAAIKEIVKLLNITEGKALILFTAKDDMQYVFKKLSNIGLPYKIMVQDESTTQERRLEKFQNNVNSVLLGTGTYWEGINVKGESLSQVIIFKLPFPVPDPIVEYKMRKTECPLTDVAVPEMIIKLKQGVGRLIRSSEDKGIVSILDSRVSKSQNTAYREDTLASLPEKNITEDITELEKFWNKIKEDGKHK